MSKPRLSWVAALMVSASLLAACGGGGGGGDSGGATPGPGPGTGVGVGVGSGTDTGSGGTVNPGPGPVVDMPVASPFKAFEPVAVASNVGASLGTARLVSGHNVVIWSSGTELWARRTDGGGVLLGEPFRVNSQASWSLGSADVAALPGGGFVVAWAQEDFQPQTAATSAYSIHLRRFAADGTAVGVEERVTQGETFSAMGEVYSATGVTVEAQPAGGFVVGWSAAPVRTAPAFAMFQRFAPDGSAVGSTVTVSSETGWSQEQLALVPLANGGLIAAWVQPTGADSYAFMWRTFDAASNPTSAATTVASASTRFAASAATLANGNVVLAWAVELDPLAAFTSEVRSMVITPDGTQVGGVSAAPSRFRPTDIAIEALGDAGYAVVWQWPDGNYRSTTGQIEMTQHDLTGALTAGPVTLVTRMTGWWSGTTGASVIASPRFAVDGGADGHVVLTFQGAEASATTFLMGR